MEIGHDDCNHYQEAEQVVEDAQDGPAPLVAVLVPLNPWAADDEGDPDPENNESAKLRVVSGYLLNGVALDLLVCLRLLTLS